MGAGGEDVVAVFMSKLFSVGMIGRGIHGLFRGGTLRTLPDTG